MRQVADISVWQGTVDFDQVKAAGVTGVIVKLSEGVNISDPKAIEHCDGARAAGLTVEGYHFARLSSGASSNAQQAIVRAQVCGVQKVWLDFEDDHNPLSRDDSTAWALAFLAAITQAGLDAGFYTFTGYTSRFAPDPALAAYPLWLANYGRNTGEYPPVRQPPVAPPLWAGWAGWQHTSVADVPGIAGHVDMSVFNDDPPGDDMPLNDADLAAIAKVVQAEVAKLVNDPGYLPKLLDEQAAKVLWADPDWVKALDEAHPGLKG